MRRPEEVFRAEAGGAAAAEAELSREERRRRRAKKKRAFQKRGPGEVRAHALATEHTIACVRGRVSQKRSMCSRLCWLMLPQHCTCGINICFVDSVLVDALRVAVRVGSANTRLVICHTGAARAQPPHCAGQQGAAGWAQVSRG